VFWSKNILLSKHKSGESLTNDFGKKNKVSKICRLKSEAMKVFVNDQVEQLKDDNSKPNEILSKPLFLLKYNFLVQ
jgi:hypothetical protein